MLFLRKLVSYPKPSLYERFSENCGERHIYAKTDAEEDNKELVCNIKPVEDLLQLYAEESFAASEAVLCGEPVLDLPRQIEVKNLCFRMVETSIAKI